MTDPFKERAADMGLDVTMEYKGLYRYFDRYSEVIYRQFSTICDCNPDESAHATDDLEMPYLGVFIRPQDAEDFKYCGFISNFYQFVGNDILNQTVRDGIASIEQPIFEEVSYFSGKHERMRNEIVIQSPVSPGEVGDVYPLIITHNGYNGTRSAGLSFGIGTRGPGALTFSFNLGQIRMIHVASASTNMAAPLNEYVQTFPTNITELISQNFETPLQEEDFIQTLDFIEELGGRRRKNSIVTNMHSQGVEAGRLPSAWQMFVAITRYTTLEPNLNMRKLLENIAERVLVIPTRMQEVLETLAEYNVT
ncbi:MAG: hypothetical protein ACTSWJ_11020 [Candidatus Heimdallarchaeaceae archaeon]